MEMKLTFGAQIECPIYSAKDPQFKEPPLLYMFFGNDLVSL
jgi:hypothetical protein